MSRNDAGDELCPGCGRPWHKCKHSNAEVRAMLTADRAEMSDRLAAQSAKCNDYLLTIAAMTKMLLRGMQVTAAYDQNYEACLAECGGWGPTASEHRPGCELVALLQEVGALGRGSPSGGDGSGE